MGHDHDDHDHSHRHFPEPAPAHSHSHTHFHSPAHTHSHSHTHSPAPTPSRSPLEEGSGSGKILFFDAFSGIAGDMTIAALLDLGVPLLVVERAVAALPIDGFHLHRGHVHRSGIVATTFDVHIERDQPERTYGDIDRMLIDSSLPEKTKSIARRIFRKLGEAEATVHRMPLESVHFHEVGAVDSIVDIVGAAACIAYLGAEVIASPLPMTHGFIRAQHGVLPLPPPAVVECLQGVPTYPVDLQMELVTPTGAAIASTLATSFERWPSFAPLRTGWGGGKREIEDRPNLLRVVLGEAKGESANANASHVVIEANIDDMTGELAAHAIEALLRAGALDAWATPITMKKGRPALTLSALATEAAADRIADTMLRETTSIGVRKVPVSRTERPRRMIEVATEYGTIPVKLSEGPYGAPQMKPEFDACAQAAEKAGVSVRQVIEAVMREAAI